MEQLRSMEHFLFHGTVPFNDSAAFNGTACSRHRKLLAKVWVSFVWTCLPAQILHGYPWLARQHSDYLSVLYLFHGHLICHHMYLILTTKNLPDRTIGRVFPDTNNEIQGCYFVIERRSFIGTKSSFVGTKSVPWNAMRVPNRHWTERQTVPWNMHSIA